MSQFTSTNASDVRFKRELQPDASGSDPTRCPNCGSFALYVDPVRGERVCDTCGFVVEESLVDQGPDWTTFEGDDRIRAGPPPSVMAPDKGLGSMVGNGLRDAKGNPIEARPGAALNRLTRASQRTRYDGTERALAPGLGQLSSLSSGLGLAPAFRERAAIILRKAIEAGLSRGRSMDAIVAAVVYLAAKQLGAPRGLHELAEATGVTVHRISLTAKIIGRELAVFSRASRPDDFVPRFASQLGLDPRVGERALALVAQGKDSKIRETTQLSVEMDTRRYGKAVTVVRGLEQKPDEAEKLARELKKGLATGGSGKDGVIVLQGDHRKDVVRLLQAKGYNVR